MKMKRFNLFTVMIAVALLMFSAFIPVAAQAYQTNGTFSTIAIDNTKATYGLSDAAITPAATPADVVTLTGSSTKTIAIKRITVSGIAASAGSMDVSIIKRTTASTCGTTCTSDLGTPSIAQFDSSDSAATASFYEYGAVGPTPLGTGKTLSTQTLNFGVAGAAGTVAFDFSTRNDKPITLRGAAQSVNINLNGQAVPTAGKISYTIEWQEY